MDSQNEKCTALAALHKSKEAWVIPNPWDAGSAQDLEKLGFKALATSSAACAYTLGKKDGAVTFDEKMAHCQSIVSNTNLPVSVDFEDGYSNQPKEVAANVLKLVSSGVAGCSIEDFSRVDQKIFDFNHSIERITAAVEAVAGLDMPFQLVARADGLLRGHADLDDAVNRLQAFSKTGAHMVYAPGLNSLEQVSLVSNAVDKPLNVLSPLLPGVSVQAIGEAGGTRISLGSALLEKTRASFRGSMKEMISSGLAS